MELLGHSQLNTTMNIYSHVIQDAQRDAAARINAVLS
jgi:integrase